MGEFKHISVTPADDDEVIIAGVGAQAESESASESVPEFAPAPEPKPETVFGKSVPEHGERPEAPAQAQPKSASVRRKATRKDEYRETTLEDLESGSMPLAQRIVIIAAVVCIIGALVYYFVFMR